MKLFGHVRATEGTLFNVLVKRGKNCHQWNSSTLHMREMFGLSYQNSSLRQNYMTHDDDDERFKSYFVGYDMF